MPVNLLHRVDSGAYAALLNERGLLALLGSRAIDLAPEATDEVLRSGVDVAMRQARLRGLSSTHHCGRWSERWRSAA
jgi:hypothetical protein